MKYVSALFSMAMAACWLLACASTPPAEVTAACDRAGNRCTCPDGSKSSLVCEDEVLVCACADVSSDSDDDDDDADAGRKLDAGRADASQQRSDGGKDAGKDAGTDVASDASAPMDDAGADAADPDGPRVPPLPSDCPAIKTGTVTVMGQRVQLWVGPKQAGKRGPILFYWHDIESSTIEAQTALGRGNSEILAEGGVIASFDTSTSKGQNTGSNWYTGDFAMADAILACAIAQQDVDPRRIHTAGCGGGGMQASAMVYARSGYLASAMANSGGTPFPYQFEDASHIPAFIGAHGALGRDKVVLDFAETTARQVADLVAKGGFVVHCDHGGDHCATPTSYRNAQWQFLKDHPFRVDPEPYSEGLPAEFPAVCKIGK